MAQQPRGQQRPQPKVTTSTPAGAPTAEAKPKINTQLPVPVKDMRQLLVQIEPELRAAIPRTVNLDASRLARLFLTTFQKTPGLQKCTGRSLLASVVQAAALGLECDGVLGHAYLIPFGNVCTLLIGYRGFIVLAMRTDQVANIFSSVVYEEDAWEVQLGTDAFVRHVPRRPAPQGVQAEGSIARNIVAFYAVCKMKDGSVKFEWMWKQDVDAIRERSRAKSDGPWVTDYASMGCKTAIRKLCKTLGLSSELTRAAVADEQVELGIDDVPLVDYETSAGLAQVGTDLRREELKERYGAGGDGGGATEGEASQGVKPTGAASSSDAQGKGESDGDPYDDPKPGQGREPGADDAS